MSEDEKKKFQNNQMCYRELRAYLPVAEERFLAAETETERRVHSEIYDLACKTLERLDEDLRGLLGTPVWRKDKNS